MPAASVLLGIFVLAGLAVLPVKTWYVQTERLGDAKQEMLQVEAELKELREKKSLLETDAEIERRARKDFGYVYPGEESYRVIFPEGSPQ